MVSVFVFAQISNKHLHTFNTENSAVNCLHKVTVHALNLSHKAASGGAV